MSIETAEKLQMRLLETVDKIIDQVHTDPKAINPSSCKWSLIDMIAKEMKPNDDAWNRVLRIFGSNIAWPLLESFYYENDQEAPSSGIEEEDAQTIYVRDRRVINEQVVPALVRLYYGETLENPKILRLDLKTQNYIDEGLPKIRENINRGDTPKMAVVLAYSYPGITERGIDTDVWQFQLLVIGKFFENQQNNPGPELVSPDYREPT